eukprot:365535-Chlamydomonas_euryale.AAC.48
MVWLMHTTPHREGHGEASRWRVRMKLPPACQRSVQARRSLSQKSRKRQNLGTVVERSTSLFTSQSAWWRRATC